MSNFIQNIDINKRQAELLMQELYEDSHILDEHFGGTGNMSSLPLIRTLASPILRKWICDREFSKIQRIIQKKVEFEVYHSQQDVKLCKAGIVKIWIEMMPAFGISIGTFHPEEKISNYDSRKRFKLSFDYKALCIQKMVFHRGKFYNRSDFVSFLANKLGGTHSRKLALGKYQEIFEASNQMGFGLKEGNVFLVTETNMYNRAEFEDKNNCTLYDLSFLVTIDTAKIFSKSVLRDVFGRPSGG